MLFGLLKSIYILMKFYLYQNETVRGWRVNIRGQKNSFLIQKALFKKNFYYIFAFVITNINFFKKE